MGLTFAHVPPLWTFRSFGLLVDGSLAQLWEAEAAEAELWKHPRQRSSRDRGRLPQLRTRSPSELAGEYRRLTQQARWSDPYLVTSSPIRGAR